MTAIRESDSPIPPLVADPTYYYSVDGSVVRGPVTADAIRRLCEQRILTASSLLCPEGAQEWQQLQPETFAPSLARAPRELVPTVGSLAKGMRPAGTLPPQVSGGIGRLTYFLSLAAAGVLVFLLLPHRGTAPPNAPMSAHDLLLALTLFGFQLVAGLILMALRLENIGHSQWLCLLIFIPLVGAIVSLYCLFAPPNCAGTRASWMALIWVVVALVLIFVASLALGVVAGIAAHLPANARPPH